MDADRLGGMFGERVKSFHLESKILYAWHRVGVLRKAMSGSGVRWIDLMNNACYAIMPSDYCEEKFTFRGLLQDALHAEIDLPDGDPKLQ